jgi:hypothetical protein
MAVWKIAAIYFALVFGAGFVLGSVRVLWLEPQTGIRAAELLEMPVMLAVILAAARFLVRRYPVPYLRTGLLALAMLLGAEIVLGVTLRGLSVQRVLLDRDPVSGAAYYASLAVFALAPWWLSRR